MQFNRKQIVILTITTFVLFLLSPPFFNHVDSGIYHAFTESIFEDGDLNVVNQLPAKNDFGPVNYTKFKNGEKGIVTTTKNYPSQWSHGSAIFLLPSYTLARLFSPLFTNKLTQKLFINLCLVFTNILLGLLGVIFLVKIKNKIFHDISNIAIYIFLSASPWLYYLIIEPGNANIISFFINTLIIYLTVSNDNQNFREINKRIFIIGMACGLATIIKAENFLITIIPFVLILTEYTEYRIKKITLFLSGGILLTFPYFINQYLMFGFFDFGYSTHFMTSYNVIIDELFSAYRGQFFITPILLFTILASIFINKNKIKMNLHIAFYLILIIKEYLLSQTYVHGAGNFGARQLVGEMSIFALMFFGIYSQLKNNLLRHPLSIIFVLWTLTMTYYNIQSDYINGPSLDYWVKYSDYINNFSLKDLVLTFTTIIYKNNYLYLKSLVFALFLLSAILLFKLKNYITIRNFIIASTTNYILITILNIFFNEANIIKMESSSFLTNTITGNGIELFTYEENINSMEERMIYIKRKNPQQFNFILNLRQEYHIVASKQITTQLDTTINLRNYFPFPENGYDHLISKYRSNKYIPEYDDRVKQED